MNLETVRTILYVAASAAGDEQAESRVRDVEDTARKISAGEPATGGPTLDELTGGPGLSTALGRILGFNHSAAKSAVRATVADKLIELGRTATLFHDPRTRAFAEVEVDGHLERHSVQSRRFKHWLQTQYRAKFERHPGESATNEALGALRGYAEMDGPERTVEVRVGRAGDRSVHIDLSDEGWRGVQIDEAGWSIVERTPVAFIRPSGKARLVAPVDGGELSDWTEFINVPDINDRLLVLAWLVHALLGKGPFPLLILMGEQGSAKSTTARVLQLMLDPNEGQLRTPPRNARDLAIAANSCWLLAYDNLSGIPPWLSDVFCRMSTGGGFATRALYTDDEEAIFSATRPILINGIDDLATRADLADRAVVIELPAIASDRRRTEEALWRRLTNARHQFLGRCMRMSRRFCDSDRA